MAFNGTRLFRYALIFEMTANAVGIVPALLYPESALSYLVKGPNQITPAGKTMMQWFGTLILTAFTVPLMMCYPSPRPSQGGNRDIVAWRRLVYMMYGVGELGLGTTMLAQYVQGDSGMTDSALLGGAANMAVLGLMRAFFLYVKPSWMDAPENAKKAH